MPTDSSLPFSRRSYSDLDSSRACRRCGEALKGGVCGTCPEGLVPGESLLDLGREWLHRTWGDGALWGSVWSAVRHPGQLTRDWCEGRREGRMSPVRTLFLVLLLDTVAAWISAQLAGEAVARLSDQLRTLTYVLAGGVVLVSLLILPGLLPADRKRTLYQHAAFALYEASFQGLFILWGCFSLLLLTIVSPAQLAAARVVLAPMGALGLAAFLVHPVAHLRGAYDLSWGQAAWRGALFILAAITAIFVLGGLIDMAPHPRLVREVHEEQMSRNPDLPTFHRVGPGLEAAEQP